MRWPLTWTENANRRELAAFEKGHKIGYIAGYQDGGNSVSRLYQAALLDRSGLIQQVEAVVEKQDWKH